MNSDYCSVQYASGITETCKAMLRDKIERYQRQHAHNLISEEMVDVLVKWQCSANGPQPYRLLPEDEFAYVQIAVRNAVSVTRSITDLIIA